MLITIVSATPFEIAPLTSFLEKNLVKHSNGTFHQGPLQVRILVTGVGMPLTAWQLGKYVGQERPDLIINAGVAGAFNRTLELGTVVNVVSERYGDLGAEEADGSFMDVHEMGLIEKSEKPFENGRMNNPSAAQFAFLPAVHGLTVNKVHGSAASIEKIKAKYTVDVESMEGAAFFLACLQEKLSFLEIRAISNYVEVRNRDNWKLGLAIEALNKVLLQMIQSFQ